MGKLKPGNSCNNDFASSAYCPVALICGSATARVWITMPCDASRSFFASRMVAFCSSAVLSASGRDRGRVSHAAALVSAAATANVKPRNRDRVVSFFISARILPFGRIKVEQIVSLVNSHRHANLTQRLHKKAAAIHRGKPGGWHQTLPADVGLKLKSKNRKQAGM